MYTQRLAEFGDKIKGKNFLIIGASGFLGSHLTDALIEMGASVYAVDNEASGRHSNLLHAAKSGRVHVLHTDIRHMDWKHLPKGVRIDGVINAACRASPEDYQKHMVETLETSSVGMRNALEIATKLNVPILFTSTSEIYGDPHPDQVPTPERYWGHVNPHGLRSCYDEGKRYAEALCMAYHREFGTNVRIARIFNTYGPRIRPDGAYARALPRFISQAQENRSITVFGDGSQTRSFNYVEDTVDGLLRVFLHDKAVGDVFNVGNDHEITILQLAEMIRTKMNSKSEIVFRPMPADDPKRRRPDITKARMLLGYEPKVALDEGLSKTIEWYLEHKNNNHVPVSASATDWVKIEHN